MSLNKTKKFLTVVVTGGSALFFLAVLVSKPRDWPDQGVSVVVEEIQGMPDAIGELGVVLKNRSKMDLVIDTFYLPWYSHAGGIGFTLARADGSVIYKQSMVLDSPVEKPVMIKRGQSLSNRLSLLDYYVNLPDELAKGDLMVSWTYRPRFMNAVATNIANGTLVLRRRTWKPGATMKP